jgi:3-oxoacyl-[acyl-carrier-protein] synthase III
MGSVVVGTGLSIPSKVANDDLARIMDTTDEWIATVKERHFVDPGTGSSDLAIEAGSRAIEYAGLDVSAVDLLITATMTPDNLAPGIAGRVQEGIGLRGAIDIRQESVASSTDWVSPVPISPRGRLRMSW